jgi:hypothetical protein
MHPERCLLRTARPREKHFTPRRVPFRFQRAEVHAVHRQIWFWADPGPRLRGGDTSSWIPTQVHNPNQRTHSPSHFPHRGRRDCAPRSCSLSGQTITSTYIGVAQDLSVDHEAGWTPCASCGTVLIRRDRRLLDLRSGTTRRSMRTSRVSRSANSLSLKPNEELVMPHERIHQHRSCCSDDDIDTTL